jgi:hypothetical protein
MLPFMFATGIENSAPTIADGRIRPVGEAYRDLIAAWDGRIGTVGAGAPT